MRVYLVLLIGLLAASSASVLIKLCSAPAAIIAAYRLSLSSLFFLSVSGVRKINPFARYAPSELWLAAASGAFLALHFATWITSLKYTSVASSVALVSTSPIFVAIGASIFLRERVSGLLRTGILVTILGTLILTTEQTAVGDNALLGNLLALVGAMGIAGYFLLGRKLRTARTDTLEYVAVVYSSSAVLLILLAALLGQPFFGYESGTYGLLILIALIPQVIGHTSFNWALKYVSATATSVITLGEPIGATILAFFVLGESLAPTQTVGIVVILIGLSLAIRGEQTRKEST